ncbi:glycerol uptake facilitator-like aquaporin [Streptomyces pristinaespiralis]
MKELGVIMGADRALARRAVAESVGSAALVAVIVGSGLQATELSTDTGVRLLANSLASAVGLGLLSRCSALSPGRISTPW